MYSLRQIYDGPVTLMLDDTADQRTLAEEMRRYKVDVLWFELANFNHSSLRGHLFGMSPYKTTLMFDSDLLFVRSFDELWELTEQRGILFTRAFYNPYGLNGTAKNYKWRWGPRIDHLDETAPLLSDEEYTASRKMLLEDGIDVNVGVMGYCRGRGDAFMRDYTGRLENAVDKGMTGFVVDEMLAMALCHKYPHNLVSEKWNCPADKYFRKINVEEANILHFFADGATVECGILGRKPGTQAGEMWFSTFTDLVGKVDLAHWYKYDIALIGNWYGYEGYFKNEFLRFARYRLRSLVLKYLKKCKRLLGFAVTSFART